MKWLEKLPGAYTLILKLKNEKKQTLFSKEVNNGKNTIGVRIPSHWISEFVKELGFPIITTSANVSGEKNMTSLDDVDENIAGNVDFILFEGEKRGKPSKIVDLSVEKVKIIER